MMRGRKPTLPESCSCVKGAVALGDTRRKNQIFRIRAISTVNFATLVRPLLHLATLLNDPSVRLWVRRIRRAYPKEAILESWLSSERFTLSF